jgi:ATP-dependent protease ClpP protease subunit
MELILEPVKPKSDSIWEDYTPIIHKGNTYDVYLTDNIASPAEYNQLVHLLNSLESYHQVNMFINNGGGAVDSAFMIRECMLRCPATINAHLSGTVASAATIIALASDNLYTSPFLSFMAHNYYHGVQGTGNQVKDYVDFTDRELKRAFKSIYNHFLTPEEIQLVTERDKEVWLNDLEVMERWENYKAKSLEHSE